MVTSLNLLNSQWEYDKAASYLLSLIHIESDECVNGINIAGTAYLPTSR